MLRKMQFYYVLSIDALAEQEYYLIPHFYLHFWDNNCMQSGKKGLILTPLHRVAMLVLVILQLIFFFYTILMLVNFHSIPFVFFNYKSLVNSASTETHYLWNVSLYLLFWLQHIVMATLKYKVNWSKIWPQFPLFERYIYNVLSGVALFITFSNVQPSYIHLFTVPSWICLPFKLYGLAIQIKSFFQLGSAIMMPFKVGQILNNKQIELPNYQPKTLNLKQTGIYSYLRHPMQGGTLFLLIFGHGVYTTERLIFVSIFCMFVVLGVLMEQSRLKVIYSEYPKYMEKVKARFIPYVI